MDPASLPSESAGAAPSLFSVSSTLSLFAGEVAAVLSCWLLVFDRPLLSPPVRVQEKKQLVFEGTVGRDMEALGRLTEDDLRFLFG